VPDCGIDDGAPLLGVVVNDVVVVRRPRAAFGLLASTTPMLAGLTIDATVAWLKGVAARTAAGS
jgi:hypothetical protein